MERLKLGQPVNYNGRVGFVTKVYSVPDTYGIQFGTKRYIPDWPFVMVLKSSSFDLVPRDMPAEEAMMGPLVSGRSLEERLTSGKSEDRVIGRHELQDAIKLVMDGKVEPIEGKDFIRIPKGRSK